MLSRIPTAGIIDICDVGNKQIEKALWKKQKVNAK
jgi:hypothetical protein